MSSTLTESARDYARKFAEFDYAVYPVSVTLNEKGKKIPQFPGKWMTGSTVNPQDVPDLWGDHTGVFIDAGKSGIVVVDVDTSGDKDGFGNLRVAGIEIPESPMTVRSWSGGEHRYFRMPDVPVSTYRNEPVKHVDVQGVGGGVFAAPTPVIGPGGVAGSYEMSKALRVEDLPVLPESFVKLLGASRQGKDTSPRVQALTGPLSPEQAETLTNYLMTDLAAIEAAGASERHEALIRNAGKVFDRGVKLGMSPTELESLIHDAYVSSGGDEWDDKLDLVHWSRDQARSTPMGVPLTDFDRKVAEEAEKIRVRTAAKAIVNSAGYIPLSDDDVLPFENLDGSNSVGWWVNGVIPRGETSLMFGAPESGKSFLALGWALGIASGTDVHGHQVSKGRVLYLAGEGTQALADRRRAWCDHHGVNPDQVAGLEIRKRTVQLHDARMVEDTMRLIREREFDLVIVDTLNRSLSGYDISNPSEAQFAVDILDKLRSVRTDCSVLAVHHPAKYDPLEPAGGYTLKAAMDVSLRASVDPLGVITLEHNKNKSGVKQVLGQYVWRSTSGSAVLVPYGNSINQGQYADPFARV